MARVAEPGSAIIALAQTQLSKPYVWATPANPRTKNPRSFDCSGFAAWLWYQCGGPLLVPQSQTIYVQYVLTHPRRHVSAAEAGDLVFYAYGGGVVDHVAIYDGNGGLYEASDPQIGLRHRPIDAGNHAMKPYVAVWPGNGNGAGVSESGAPATTVQGSLEQYIYDQYTQVYHLSPAQASAVLGSNSVETGGTFSPTTYNANENAWGIAQWEGSRLTALQQYAQLNGKNWKDLDTQIAFEMTEAQQRGNLAGLRGYSDPSAGAFYWAQHFEGSAQSNWQERADRAAQIFHTVSSGGRLTGGVGGITLTSNVTPPFAPSSLSAPLTSQQRAQILGFIAAVGQPNPPVSASSPDEQLIAAYAADYVKNNLRGLGSPQTDLKNSVFGQLGGVLSWLTTAKNWERVGLFALGAVILLFAAFEFFGGKGSAGDAVKSTAGALAL